MRLCYRRHVRRARRPTTRSLNRSCVRVRWRGPDDLGQALTAFNRALRAHRHMARLAPSFFDTAVIDREAFNRAEQRRWMATWEPVLARVYGVEHTPPPPADDLPPLPPPQTQRAVKRHLAAFWLWMEAGRTARERHQQRHPHALPSLSRLARLLELAFEFKKLAVGLDSPNPLPDKITYDYNLTDIKRAYGHQINQSPPVNSAPAKAVVPPSAATSAPVPQSKPPPPPWSPPETKRDITPVKLVIGPHGLLCYEYPKPDPAPDAPHH